MNKQSMAKDSVKFCDGETSSTWRSICDNTLRGDNCDVALTVGYESARANKAVLAAASHYFYEMFSACPAETKLPRNVVVDDTFTDTGLIEFLAYTYQNKTSLSLTAIMEVIVRLDMYDMPDQLAQKLLETLCFQTIIKIWVTAHHCNKLPLVTICEILFTKFHLFPSSFEGNIECVNPDFLCYLADITEVFQYRKSTVIGLFLLWLSKNPSEELRVKSMIKKIKSSRSDMKKAFAEVKMPFPINKDLIESLRLQQSTIPSASKKSARSWSIVAFEEQLKTIAIYCGSLKEWRSLLVSSLPSGVPIGILSSGYLVWADTSIAEVTYINMYNNEILVLDSVIKKVLEENYSPYMNDDCYKFFVSKDILYFTMVVCKDWLHSNLIIYKFDDKECKWKSLCCWNLSERVSFVEVYQAGHNKVCIIVTMTRQQPVQECEQLLYYVFLAETKLSKVFSRCSSSILEVAPFVHEEALYFLLDPLLVSKSINGKPSYIYRGNLAIIDFSVLTESAKSFAIPYPEVMPLPIEPRSSEDFFLQVKCSILEKRMCLGLGRGPYIFDIFIFNKGTFKWSHVSSVPLPSINEFNIFLFNTMCPVSEILEDDFHFESYSDECYFENWLLL